MVRHIMVIDLFRCIGCNACIIGCKAEHGSPPGVFWRRVLKTEAGEFPNVRKISLPINCMHCAKPICKEVCPTGATYQREDGTVLIDKEKCIGCRYCIQACPYGTRYFVSELRKYFPDQDWTPYEEFVLGDGHDKGVVEKCDFCIDRVLQGMQPACVANCITKALFFGDKEDPQSEVSQLLRSRKPSQLNPEFGTDPQVYYIPP